MKKVFISQPMRGWEDEEILAFRNIIKMNLEKSLDDDIEIIDSFYKTILEKLTNIYQFII